MAQAINAMLDRINEAYRSQMRFVSDASHELRTPHLCHPGLRQSPGSMGARMHPDTMQEAIDAIRSEADAMKELVEQLLFLARGTMIPCTSTRRTLTLRRWPLQVLKETEMIDQTHLFSAQWSTGPVPVHADLGLIKQCLRVLVDNSIKYTSAGGRITPGWEAGGALPASLSRTRARASTPKVSRIFLTAFFRTDQSRARQTGGTGLGLAIAKWIVERHGGWFEVPLPGGSAPG